MSRLLDELMPDSSGFFGEYGGCFVPPQLESVLKEITDAYNKIKMEDSYKDELAYYAKHFIGRPSPLYYAENLSNSLGGAKIYLKREDLNHTGAHKINHCIGEAILAKRMGKKRLIAETGAGQHGVALATAAALVGLECHIYMGEVDIAKEHPNVVRMKILGAKVIPVTHGLKTLKEAVDSAFEAYLEDPQNQLYAIGSVVGPHPFPMMVRDFQQVIGEETKEQFKELTNKELPDYLVACVGGGSNALGLFTAFLNDPSVEIYGVEPGGKNTEVIGEHAATLTKGVKGMIHGFKCYNLQDSEGNPLPVHSVASGLDYPGVGPQHSYLHDLGRVNYVHISDKEAIDAFFKLSRVEGIIPAIESAHAIAHAIKMAPTLSKDKTIVVNLSGRGDKDIDYVVNTFGKEYGIK